MERVTVHLQTPLGRVENKDAGIPSETGSAQFNIKQTAICQVCKMIFRHLVFYLDINSPDSGLLYPYSATTLISSAKNGCGVCSFFKSQIWGHSGKPYGGIDGDAELRVWFARRAFTLCSHGLSNFRWRFAMKDKIVDGMSMPYSICQCQAIRHSFIRAYIGVKGGAKAGCDTYYKFDVEASEENHLVNASPMSDLRLAQARFWITQCEAEHTPCSTRYDTSFMPTRLIDVGRKGVSPRLVETKNETLHDNRYLALSHCWGKSIPDHGLTNLATLKRRLAKIPLLTLPKTFKDAILVTRRLGIQYIWIDSLCIIQDIVDDWQRESALMGKVYSNCYCMIAAESSANCHGGLFQQTQESAVFIDYRNSLLKAHLRFLLKPSGSLWQKTFLESPLLERGWTLQERELSPRVLYFTNNGMHFECREACGEGLPGWRTNYNNVKLLSRGVFYRDLGVQRCMDPFQSRRGVVRWIESLETRYNSWMKMIEGYSKRKLSISSDKFPAISGLAAEYSYILQDKYVAGLWQKDLIRGLCWRSSQTIPQISSTKYGPSWSWARLTDPISYDLLVINKDEREFPVFARTFPYDIIKIPRKFFPSLSNDPSVLPYVLEVETIPEGNDPNGTLSSALIHIRARVANLEFTSMEQCFLGENRLNAFWDVIPHKSWSYRILSLGKVGLGLILVSHARKKGHFVRVGIAEIPRAQVTDVEEIYLI